MNSRSRTSRYSAARHFLLAITCMALVVGACASSTSSPQASSSEGAPGSEQPSAQGSPTGDITVALPDEPASLDPCDATYTENSRILVGNVTEALLDRDPDTGELIPVLATDWTEIDASTYEFKLRDGVTFSDGTALDATRVAEAINRSFEPSLNCGIKGFIFNDEDLRAEPAGDRVVRVTSTKPDPILPLRLSFLQIGGTPGTAKQDAPIGTGPYRLETWDRGQQVVLAANDSYWGAKPSIASVRYVWRPESSVRASMVETEEADLTIAIAPQDATGPLVQTFTLAETLFMRMDTFAEPLNDVRVRRAINYAIDREGLIQSLFPNMAEPASQIVVKNVSGYNPAIGVWPFDVDEAKRLIAEAKADGVDVDKDITVYGRQGFFPNSELAMEAIAGMLRDVGLTTHVEQLEVKTWLDNVLRKPFPPDRVALTENVHGNNAGDLIFTVVTKLSSAGDESPLQDPKIDQLVDQASASEGDERTATFQKLMLYVNDEVVPFAPIAHLRGALMTTERLQYTPNLQTWDILRISEMSLK